MVADSCERAPGQKDSRSITQPTIYDANGYLLDSKGITRILQNVPNFEVPTQTSFLAEQVDEHTFDVVWDSTFPSGATHSDRVKLTKCKNTSSRINHEDMTWDEFREFALAQDDRTIYRGQGRRWRLQTSFHKAGRADMVEYLDNEVPELERHVNAFSSHEYNYADDRQLGALLNLAQHHGYPTPLLDWTRSPYVAAFFAYENESLMKPNGKVSVFMFDEGSWSEMAGRSAPMRTPKLILRTLALPGHGNARVLPQQSVTMYSNADDIEWVVQTNERERGEFLKAISLPADLRSIALRDLSLMGITWGSLFPGLDGACKELRIRHFGD